MFIRKSQIANVIKNERQKEHETCEKSYKSQIQRLQKELFEQHKKSLAAMTQEHQNILLQKDKEIKKLRKEIESSETTYREIRRREKHLEDITFEVEDIVDQMVIKVQESLQPFYRTRAKVEAIGRKSDKTHDKVESIFRVVK